jgi:heme-degrading monooxygenase HmoA
MSPVTVINNFVVPADREDEFLALLAETNAYMRAKPGYIGHTLYRSLDPGARFHFVNVPVWNSAEDLKAARDEGFRELVSQSAWREFSHVMGLYEVARTDLG